MKKRSGKILVQVGLLVAALFGVAALVNGTFIYHSSSNNYINMLKSDTEHVLLQTRTDMEKYASLPWLLDYWQLHHGEMELPGDRARRAEAMTRLLLDRGIDSLYAVTAEQAEGFSPLAQRQFAEACYLALMPLYYDLKSNFEVDTLSSTVMPTMDTALPIFSSLPEGELTAYGNFCALGEERPFNAPLHPALAELYGERADRTYFEQVTSTVTNTDYLIGYLPVFADGTIRCHICASYAMTELNETIARNLRVIERVNILIMLLAAALLLLLIYLSVLRNLQLIQRTVRQFREDKDSKAAVSNLMGVRAKNEVGSLADDISDMTVELKRYTGAMVRLTAEKERIGAELSLAAGIQTHMLPNLFPAFPARREFDIYATMDPAKEVGGDIYDFFMIDGGRLGMVVADVSGKGVPAALFSMIAKTLLKTQAQMRLSPADVLSEVNASLSENNDEDMFVTVWLGVLEISTGELTYADAGHEKLLLYQDGAWRFLPKSGGAALAMWEPEDLELMDEKYQFRNETIRLGPGDAIFQYTDGVTEATDAANVLFGEDRLLDAMNSAPSAKPEELLPYVREKIDAFVKDAPQFDDITMLGLRMNDCFGS